MRLYNHVIVIVVVVDLSTIQEYDASVQELENIHREKNVSILFYLMQ